MAMFFEQAKQLDFAAEFKRTTKESDAFQLSPHFLLNCFDHFLFRQLG